MQAARVPARVSLEARSKAVLEVQLRLDGGEEPEDAIAFLVSRGLPPRDARELVDNFVSEARNDNRRRGVTRLVIGASCLLVAIPVLYSALSADVPAEMRIRGFGSAVGMLGTLVAAGGWLVYRGLRLILSGHRTTGG